MSEQETSVEGIPGLVERLRRLPDNLMPSEDSLRETIGEYLHLSNPNFPREGAVEKVVSLVTTWFRRYGRDSTIHLVNLYLIGKTHTVIRRLDDVGTEHSTGDRRNQDQPDRVSEYIDVAEGEHDGSVRPQTLRLIEGGGSQGSGAGVAALEPPAGTAHSVGEEGVSRRLVVLELAEHTEDLRVFQKAYNGIRARVRTVEDEGRLMKLVTWSGTTASLGLLELVIHNIERVMAELREIIQKVDTGIVPNIDEE
jgi:hypothetical protein